MSTFNEKNHPRVPKGNENGGEFTDKQISKSFIKDILKKAQIPFGMELSFIYGSEYWVIDGEYYRVSDHSKNKNDSYQPYKLGENDFRNHNDFYEALKKRFDLTDITSKEISFKKSLTRTISVNNQGDYVTKDGAMFEVLENALNYAWKKELKKNKPQIKYE